jgi:hypothetical protein
MTIIYDMADGRTQSLPEKKNTIGLYNEIIPGLAVRELSSIATDRQPRTVSVHLVRALLNKG